MSFSVEGSRFVTNLTQDVTNLEENVAAPHQLMSITAQLDYEGKDYSGIVDKAIGVIRISRASKLAEKMNGTVANKFMKLVKVRLHKRIRSLLIMYVVCPTYQISLTI